MHKMGKLKGFEIVLNENKAVFHPGGKIVGKVIVELKGDMKMRSLRIFMRGVAKVHWTESRSTGSRLGSYTEHFNAEVEYFFKRQVLFGGEVSEGRDVLTEGRHEFNFEFDLPMGGIATSFEGKHGNIRYWLKAEMDKPWGFNNKTKKAFTVISPIDINKPEYQVCVESSVEKTLCCWLFTSGPISITARTDRKGYCPGESIAISAEFDNLSKRTVIPYATLYQTQAYFASGKSRVRKTKFTVLTGLPVGPGTRGSWDSQLLKIPAVSPSIINCCVMKVDYFVKVALHIPGAYNLTMHLPIMIGTVPFRRGVFNFTDSNFYRETQAHYNAMTFLGLPNPPPYRETITPPPPFEDPPTYAESVSGAVNLWDEDDDRNNPEENMGDLTYTPLYTYVYNYRPPPNYTEVAQSDQNEIVFPPDLEVINGGS
ncbi:arrestin domain-containing protein 3-like [Ruditapes philippinarum]|uniref:arrestin domain-containing protein 3-like n=1 Tax=Ruditapes philippinarum TaxID=129788 RepID=UPI00295BB3EE|nr:arrestin domain-containing protein 3-like [Ruditapes philippinarum]